MKRKTGILGVLIAILLIGIGYAAISTVNLVITGNGTISPSQDSFKVVYTNVTVTSKNPNTITVTPDAISTDGDVTTGFTVTGMSKKDDTVTLTYTITNKSPDLKASLAAPTLTNTNSTYFSVSSELATAAPVVLTANGATTTQTVTVTAIKTPVTADETATVTTTVVATPQVNS